MSTRTYDIAAIPTRYRDQLFRSRAEAKWAVFFHTRGIPYRYEPETYELPGGTRYLPDFSLFKGQLLAEVKPTHPTAEEFWKGAALSEALNVPLIFLIDCPSTHAFHLIAHPHGLLPEGCPPEDSLDSPSWARIEDCRRCEGVALAIYWEPNDNGMCGAWFLGEGHSDRCDDRWPIGVNREAVYAALNPEVFFADGVR